MDITQFFSNREIATAICYVLIVGVPLLFVHRNKYVRNNALAVIRSIIDWSFSFHFGCILIYILVLLFILGQTGIWHTGMWITTLLWLPTPIISHFTAICELSRNSRSVMRESVLKLVNLTVILECVVGISSFPLYFELILCTIILVLRIFSRLREKTGGDEKVRGITTKVIWLFLFCGVINSLWNIHSEPANINLWELFIVPVMSACFIPYLIVHPYFITFHHGYSQKKLPPITGVLFWYLVFKLVSLFRDNFELLRKSLDNLSPGQIKTKLDADLAISRLYDIENKKHQHDLVAFSDGWSVKIMDDLFHSLGMHSQDYEEDRNTLSARILITVNGSKLKNVLEITLYKTLDVVTQIVFGFIGSDPDRIRRDYLSFVKTFKMLYEAVMREGMPKSISYALNEKRTIALRVKDKEVRVIYDPCANCDKAVREKVYLVIRNLDSGHSLPEISRHST